MNHHVEDETYSNMVGSPSNLSGPRLVAIWEGGAASISLPDSGNVVVGRSARCELQIEHGSVSREHAVLRFGEVTTIEDLGSSNGVRVDGKDVRPGEVAEVTSTSFIELGATMLQIQQGLRLVPGALSRGAVSTDSSEPRMSQTMKLASLVAAGAISVIIRGETGAGKEVLAKYLHDQSPRAARPFLRINCAAFAESMVESELFGHERGAFTGAHQVKPGLLESANGGTVLLDEVGELSLATQAKLLRAIGNREVIRIGATRPRPIDVRILAATHRDLEGLIDEGAFRADLYFRLNGITLEVPPLRQRPEEILPLAAQLLEEEAKRLGIPQPRVAPATERALLEHSWPGNIRELRSVMERAILLASDGVIQPEHCVLEQRSSPRQSRPGHFEAAPRPAGEAGGAEQSTGAQLKDEMRELERKRIVAAIAECGGNQTKAARLLGISRRALLHRLDAYGLPRPRKGTPTK